MAPRTHTARAIVLDRCPGEGSFERYTLLAAELGVILALHRHPGKRQPAGLPDLLSRGEWELERPEGSGLWFVRSARVEAPAASLGRHYDALRLACRAARVLAAHPLEASAAEVRLAGLVRALDAFATGQHPEAVYLKWLYRLGREEGLAVRESWLAALPASDKVRAENILGTPTAQLGPEAARAQALCGQLERWLSEHGDFRFPVG